MKNNLLVEEIIATFEFKGVFLSAKYHHVGNINDTFIFDFNGENGTVHKYIVQKINHNIFTKPEKLMGNIGKITRHIANKVIEQNGDVLRETLNLVKTKDGQFYYKSLNGDYWRAFLFIEGARTYNKAEKPVHMYEAGKALGKFQKQLADFNPRELFEVIEDFHNTPKRYEDFIDAMEKDKANRVKDSLEEIKFIMNRADDLSKLINLFKEGKIPLRCTHNDTKFNNIMIDNKSDKAICIIDLDTVMPGLSLYDFGDAIRSGCCTASEDEIDLSKVKFDMELYENFIRGLLEESKEILNKYELENIAFSVKLITMELAIRFLTDYLNGDVYFKIMRENHNLDRTRNQLKLVSEVEMKMNEMDELVRTIEI